MKKTRCFFALMLAMMMIFSTSAMALELSAPGELPLSSEKITFTVGVPQSSVVEDWETNAQTLRLEKDLNVDLQFVELPSQEKELIQKVELMMMAGGEELPDIIMSGLGGLENLVKYGQMGMIVPTTEYYETQNGFINETLAINNMKLEDVKSIITDTTGIKNDLLNRKTVNFIKDNAVVAKPKAKRASKPRAKKAAEPAVEAPAAEESAE